MNLSADLQQFVGKQISCGNYETFDELVADALTVLREKREAEFYEQIDLGRRQIENGECTVLSTKAEVHEFFEKIRNRKPHSHSESAAHSEPAAQSEPAA
jgi:Arc/MetJ-type ribon-helix-helix transcriptional regulator